MALSLFHWIVFGTILLLIPSGMVGAIFVAILLSKRK